MRGAGASRRQGDARTRAVSSTVAVALLSVALLTTAACSSGSTSAPSPGPNQPSAALDPTTGSSPSASSSSTAGSTQPQADPQDEPTPTAKVSRPPDPEAPATVRPVERPGSTGTTVALDAARPTRATWRDGLVLTVSDVKRSTTSGRGRGAMPGSPQTTFTVALDNRSDRTVDVSRVVLTLSYGAGTRRLAQRVYDDATHDFSGVVERGAQQRAVYAFALPSDRSSAALVVDLDGRHALATLQGVAR
jgi:hypothetical protein